MTTTELGSGMGSRTPARDELVFKSDVVAEIRRQLGPELTRLEQLLRSQAPKQTPAPVVNVPAPVVHVAAPSVSLKQDAPILPEAADINLTLPGMADLRGAIDSLGTKVSSLCDYLMRPVTRTVVRDSNGLITSITERRI